jgi:hypothetical protein
LSGDVVVIAVDSKVISGYVAAAIVSCTAAFSMSLIWLGLTQSSTQRALRDSIASRTADLSGLFWSKAQVASETIEYEHVLSALPQLALEYFKNEAAFRCRPNAVGYVLSGQDPGQKQQ